jgi:hypothetical protein
LIILRNILIIKFTFLIVGVIKYLPPQNIIIPIIRWDGKFNGKPVTSGTYFYLIDDTKKVLKKGWLEITN